MKTLMTFIFTVLFCFQGLTACKDDPDREIVENTPPKEEPPKEEPPKEEPPPVFPSSSAAADYIEGRLNAVNQKLYVYKDFVDGLNNFTQKAWMGDTNDHVPPMNEAAGGYSGTGIAATLDLSAHLWGGYMIINGTFAAAESLTPYNNLGEFDAGLDLTGARKLVFYARGDKGGEEVEFFLAGLGWLNETVIEKYPDSTPKVSAGVVTLSKEWKQYEIDLTGKNLTRIACGFGWVANDRTNAGTKKITFYMDEIYYEFEESLTGPQFLQSYASRPPETDASIINAFAYLYDNAAAAMALSYAGKHEPARQIANAIVYALDNDRYFSDGRLRNAYANGDPRSYPGWFSVLNRAFARLPGFWDLKDAQWYEDAYAVGTSTGNLAWAVLSLCEVYKNAPEHREYLEAARKIGDFILTLKGGRNGFTGGYEDWEERVKKATYLSTEHNIDLITAFHLLSELSGGNSVYQEASNSARDFVLSMYDSEKGCFYTGTATDGVTINREVLPLDCNTWAVLALKDDFKDAAKVMAFVEENMAVGGGYDFNTDKDGAWFEGTAQVALAYLQTGNTAKYHEIMAYLNGNTLSDGSIYAADRDGVTTGFMVSGVEGVLWKYDKREHIGATAWLAFAQLGRNPF
jgi:hypothetical protein